jgi:hypothetical protein
VFREPIANDRPYSAQLVQAALSILEREFGSDGAPLDESAVTGWLDEVYAGEAGVRWEAEYAAAAQEFQDAVLATLYPFQSDEGLEECFYRAFDGTEVLPVSLEAEYRRLRDEEPLQAASLWVPIRWGQWAQMKKAGALRRMEPDRVWVADRPYSYAGGLEI